MDYMEEHRPNYLRRFKTSKYKNYILVGAVLIIVLFLLVRFNPFSTSNSQAASTSGKTALKDAIATQPLNKEFKFPLKGEKDAVIGQIKYVIENAELRDEIIVKGKKASAVSGRTFLILNLKISNETNQTISMNTKDYVRLFINGNEQEPLSPSIHNDPVVVEAISVKPTRIGFAINESDNNLKIKVGEIKGEKQTVDLNLSR
jgi:hypothetical protein